MNGMPLSWLLLIALISVWIGGQNNVWCMNFTWLRKYGMVCMLLATWLRLLSCWVGSSWRFCCATTFVADAGAVGLIGRRHSFESGSLSPISTNFLLK